MPLTARGQHSVAVYRSTNLQSLWQIFQMQEKIYRIDLTKKHQKLYDSYQEIAAGYGTQHQLIRTPDGYEIRERHLYLGKLGGRAKHVIEEASSLEDLYRVLQLGSWTKEFLDIVKQLGAEEQAARAQQANKKATVQDDRPCVPARGSFKDADH